MSDPFLGCMPDGVHLASYPFTSQKHRVSPYNLAESNTSVIARLCWYYRIKPLNFLTAEVESESTIQGVTLTREIGFRYNGYGKSTKAFMEKFRKLTGVETKAGCYSHLDTLLDPAGHGFMASSKKWCPLCYKERFELCEQYGILGDSERPQSALAKLHWMRRNPPCVWDDLYWSLEFCRMCVKHNCELADRCRECLSLQPYISNEIVPGHCTNCFARLDKTIVMYFPENQVESHKLFLLPFLSELSEPVSYSLDSLLSNLDDLKVVEPMFDDELLSEIAGFGKDVIKHWRSRKTLPSIHSLFAIQNGLELGCIFYLLSTFGDFYIKAQFSPNLSLKLKHRNDQKNKLVVVSAHLNGILSGEIPYESREKVAERFGVSVGFIYHTFGNLLSQIAAKRKDDLSKRRLSQSGVEELVRSAITRCVHRGRKVTVPEIIGLIPKELVRKISPAQLSDAIQSELRFITNVG